MASQHKVSSGQRQQMIAEAAYFRAERRGFAGGDAVRDWCEAEAEVDARLRQIEDEELVARIEEILVTASKKLAALRRKAARVSAEARVEWRKDTERLAALYEALRPKLAELREQGSRAGLKLREQAERIRADIAELVRKLEAKAKH
jgi:hypothetical protein